MSQQKLNSFLNNMFKDNVEFRAICGTANSMDMKYMLVADAVSEDIELLADVIKEHLKNNTNSFSYTKRKEQGSPCFAYRR